MHLFRCQRENKWGQKYVVWQILRNFAPLFGVVRALVRHISCRVG